ncbi:O-succinylhomoserine (thiol)-lyase [Candidatus Pantoea edessiphila]|uniref:O-succinylhomoserine (Thiol)-lyase n=1 Tax=Candidatus Pantoea edessiphila TaxID=2044610 RepID=A0A2P5SZ64_9GAMM|nr:cystathionine gamma-synthase [Candidatus Pantoea edessiphila]MBK4775269.1 cystathionine gamma-synthase [Pantoea sp. Edef]PPI87592.1 O-succinylhomoserine (thiol)-lyase [Candidatus Pantoea edessiphila]
MDLKKATIAVHSGLNNDIQYGCVSPPIYLSSTYNFIGFNEPRFHDYSRRSNPTRDIVQKALSDLEGGVGSVLTNTGMSAIHLVTMSFLKPGDLLIAPHDCYGGSYRLFQSMHNNNLYKVKFINQSNLLELQAAFNEKPRLIFIESPSNPLLRVVNISMICELAHKTETISVVDNTFMTPALQNPIYLGADIIVHSCTKYINGHSDVLAGIVISKDPTLIDHLSWWANNIGVTAAAFDSYLLLRSIRTLLPRIDIAQNNALAIVDYLKQQKLVKKIYHPSLVENIGYKYAVKQQKGFGAILSMEIDGNKEILKTFLKSLKLFTLAESLGGVESLICHAASMTHASMSYEARNRAGISDMLLRISVGIEDKQDLISDLDSAFKIASDNI